MRVSIHVDGATTPEIRSLIVALHRAGHTGALEVGCDGPTLWNARTPKMMDGSWQKVLELVPRPETYPSHINDAIRQVNDILDDVVPQQRG